VLALPGSSAWPGRGSSKVVLCARESGLAWLVSHEAVRIHEHTRTAHQVYQKADDAISDIQANINKGALIEQSGFSNAEPSLQRALIATEFGDAIRFASPPGFMQAILFPLLAPIARRRGYRSSYNEYVFRSPSERLRSEATMPILKHS
jgi:hypothetical protein